MPKHTRCRGECKKWFHLDDISLAGCPACDFRTARCESCGGSIGAMRSVLCHVAYWRTRGKRVGGHQEKFKLWASQVRARLIRKATKAVSDNLGLH